MYAKSFLVIIAIIIISLFSGCKKELISENLNIEEKQYSSQKITIQEAKLKYKQNSSVVKHSAQSRTGNFSPVDYFNLELFWDLSIFPQNFNGNILMVPIKDKALFLENWTEAFMVFYRDNANQVVQEMMIFIMDKSHYESTSGYPNVSNFTGFSFHVEIDGNASGFCYYQNGIMTSYAADLLFNEDGTISNPALSAQTRMPWWDEMWVAICQFCGWGVVCPPVNSGGGSGGNFWKGVGDYFRNLNEGGFDGFDGADFGAFFDGSGYGPGGRWTFGNSGSGGSDGGNNPSRNLRDYFSELQIKQFTKSVEKLNNYFNWNKSLLEYFVDFNIDADCLAEIAKLPENSIDGIESLPCLQELIKFVAFNNNYNLGLTYDEFSDFSSGCDINDLNFENCLLNSLINDVFEEFGETLPSNSSGFFDCTLACNSFEFVAQQSGDGQIACVNNLYLSKNFGGGMYSQTSSFCGHFTVPKIRYNGQVISAGQAADCSAWASNAAATIVGFLFAKSNYQMSDYAIINAFKVAFKSKMALTNCGYGIITNCDNADCISSPKQAVWNVGFFDWLEEQAFGCN